MINKVPFHMPSVGDGLAVAAGTQGWERSTDRRGLGGWKCRVSWWWLRETAAPSLCCDHPQVQVKKERGGVRGGESPHNHFYFDAYTRLFCFCKTVWRISKSFQLIELLLYCNFVNPLCFPTLKPQGRLMDDTSIAAAWCSRRALGCCYRDVGQTYTGVPLWTLALIMVKS